VKSQGYTIITSCVSSKNKTLTKVEFYIWHYHQPVEILKKPNFQRKWKPHESHKSPMSFLNITFSTFISRPHWSSSSNFNKYQTVYNLLIHQMLGIYSTLLDQLSALIFQWTVVKY